MLDGITYCPIMYSKNAELNALSNVREELREGMFPILSLRPLPHAHHLSHTIDRIRESHRGRFGLDLDFSRYGRANSLQDATEFSALFLHNDGFERYYKLVESIPEAVPVLVRYDGDCQFLDSQIDRAFEVGRGLIVRIERERFYGAHEVIERVIERGIDCTFIIDAGWSRDVLLAQPWTHSLVAFISDVDPDAEIVISSSSFPNSFSHMGAKGLSTIDDRELFRRLRQSTNANLIYGDWGSTRRSNEATFMRAVPRIDLAHPGEWLSYRRVGSENFEDIACRLVNDEGFAGTADCWGKSLISQVADGNPDALKGSARATAARINMHLTAQASNQAGITLPDETPYVDPF